MPYTKQGLKGLRKALEGVDPTVASHYYNEFEASRKYNMATGNLYTGSLYLSLLSLLENTDTLKAGDRLGLFSYGSGDQGEFAEYEQIFSAILTDDHDRKLDISKDPAQFVLAGIKDFKRQYLKK